MDKLQKFSPILHTGFAENYTKEQMREFTDWCLELGYSGFSVEGKATEKTNDIDKWLEGFLRGVCYASEEAAKKDLEVWLFDEWGYPTGTAAGKTLQGNVQWRSKKLHLIYDIPLEAGQSVDLSLPKHFLAAASWHVGRDIFGGALEAPCAVMPIDGRIKYTAAAKRERLCVVSWEYDCFRTVGVFIPDPEEDKQGTLDLLCHEAVRHFISEMHARYIPVLSGYLGKTVKGFFYDEPFASFPAPYTFDIMEEFQSTKGYDIIPRLPMMLAGLDRTAMLDYRDVCTTRLAQAFYRQMAEFCHSHGVSMVGHQDLDHSTRTLNSVSGDFFKNSAYNDGPGVDYIWAQIRPGLFADYPRFAGSARRLMGKEHAISESFAATVSGKSPDYMRYCMEHQLIRGIDKFFLMIADPIADSDMHQTPLSKNHKQSQGFAKVLNRRIALTNSLLSGTVPAAQTAIYIPMDALFDNLLNLKMPSAVSVAPYRPVWEYIDAAAEILCYLPVDFDYIWKDAVLSLPIENGAFVTPEGQSINTLIIPPCAIPNTEIHGKLNEFLCQGGKLLFLNTPPVEFIGKGIVCPDIDTLKCNIARDVVISSAAKLSLAQRHTKQRELYFLLNEDENKVHADISFPENGMLEKYDFELEEWRLLDSHSICETFESGQLNVYSAAERSSSKPALKVGEVISEIKNWTVTLPNGKILQLNSLSDWASFWTGDYVGWMGYNAKLDIAESGIYRICLGKVCYAAKVSIDSEEKSAAFAPYYADFYLSQGNHAISVSVLNTDANAFYGTVEAQLNSINEPWLKNKMESDRKYLTSGLLGPVTVHKLL